MCFVRVCTGLCVCRHVCVWANVFRCVYNHTLTTGVCMRVYVGMCFCHRFQPHRLNESELQLFPAPPSAHLESIFMTHSLQNNTHEKLITYHNTKKTDAHT